MENRVLSNASTLAAPPDPDKPIRIARFFSYPDEVLYFIASFIGLIVLCHFLTVVYTFTSRAKAFQPGFSLVRGRVSLRRLPLALHDTFRAIAFRLTVPVGEYYTLNIAEFFLTVAYAAVLFTWTLVNTKTTTGVKFEAHYFANRAGTIAATQLPIMTALGMRNNLFSLLTGVSFDKLNYLHRASARILCVLVWLHGAGRLKLGLSEANDGAATDRWVQCGFLAASALTILCITTIRPVRQRSYEAFLVVHFLFAFIFLLSIYFHAQGRHLVFYGIWPSFLLWGLDRLLRILRVLIFNPNPLKSESNLSSLDVLSPNFLRLTVPCPLHFHWLPGQSAFLIFSGVSASPFESHPFTIMTIDGGDHGISNGKASQPPNPARNLVFLMRVRHGATRRLLESASTSRQASVKVILDGPYSSPPLLVGYGTVILIAGGSGVAFTLPLLLDLLLRLKTREPACCSRIVFVWAIRDIEHINWISDSLHRSMQNVPSCVVIDIRAFVTAAAEDAQSWDVSPASNSTPALNDAERKMAGGGSHGSSSSEPQLLDYDLIKVQSGRPDFGKILNDEILCAAGPISVNVCGTHALTKGVRNTLRRPRILDILRGGPTIALHVEAFGGA